jgi:hypothetical protein
MTAGHATTWGRRPAQPSWPHDNGADHLVFLFVLLFLVLALGSWQAFLHADTQTQTQSQIGARLARALGLGSPPLVRQGYDPQADSGADEVAEAVTTNSPPPQSTPVADTAGSAATLPEPPAEAALASVVPRDEVLRIAHTDGRGVVLRTAPRADARVPRGLLEGTRVTVLGSEGATWVHVRAESGLDGWIPSQYLAPLPPP